MVQGSRDDLIARKNSPPRHEKHQQPGCGLVWRMGAHVCDGHVPPVTYAMVQTLMTPKKKYTLSLQRPNMFSPSTLTLVDTPLRWWRQPVPNRCSPLFLKRDLVLLLVEAAQVEIKHVVCLVKGAVHTLKTQRSEPQ